MTKIEELFPGRANTMKAAYEAQKFYEEHADALDNPQLFKRRHRGLTDDGFAWEACVQFCQINAKNHNGLRFSHRRFREFVANWFGVTIADMNGQWKNVNNSLKYTTI